MKKLLCIFLTVITVVLMTVPAFAEGKYVFDFETDDLLEFAQIASTFGEKAGVRAQSDSKEEYDVRRTVMVKTDGEDPDLKDFKPDVTIDGPDDVFVLSFSTVEKARECAQILSGRSGVVYAECDTTVSVNEGEPHSEEEYEGDGPDEETDISYHSWGIEYMHADVLAREVKKVQAQEDEVIVAVVDSGINSSHPLFEGRLSECKDMTASETGYNDDSGHGTNVAGVVADSTQGVNVKIMAIKVLDSQGNGSAMIAAVGLEYAARNGADIINASFVSKNCSVRFHDAQKVAEENDCVLVVSAGNHGIDMDKEVCCPSHIKEVVTVTAINDQSLPYKSNCFGSMVDVTAPGVGITCASKNGGYMQNTGTSFAAPHVAAIAAMYKLFLPTADVKKICAMIKNNTLDLGEKGFDVNCGWGMPWLKNFPQDAVPRVVDKVSIETFPDKMTYIYKNESFDQTGLTIKVEYDDGTTEVLTNAFFVSCPELKYGKNTVTVTLGEESTEFTVEVKYTWWQWIIVILLFGWIWYR